MPKEQLNMKLSFQHLPAYLRGDYCMLSAADISEMRSEEKRLLELSRLLKNKLVVTQHLRMQLIDNKISAEAVMKKLNNTNKKLTIEIARLKLNKAELKQKLKQKKAIA